MLHVYVMLSNKLLGCVQATSPSFAMTLPFQVVADKSYLRVLRRAGIVPKSTNRVRLLSINCLKAVAKKLKWSNDMLLALYAASMPTSAHQQQAVGQMGMDDSAGVQAQVSQCELSEPARCWGG